MNMDSIQIHDFLESYRPIDLDKLDKVESLQDLSNITLEDSIYRKMEFNSNKLDKVEKVPLKKGDLLNHQKIVSNFLSSYTPYNGILLYHEPGTGKTCSSIAITEKIRNENTDINGAVIITRGETLINQFIDQLVFSCTAGQYLPSDYKEGKKDPKLGRKIKQNIKDFYTFYTFHQFAKFLHSLRNNKEEKKRIFSNKVIVIDEVHNIRAEDEVKEVKESKESKQTKRAFSIYKEIHDILHLVEGSKVVLMSGTPMVDQPHEIADVMNFILPEKEQLPTGEDFNKKYMKSIESKEEVKNELKNKLKNKLRGRISYLKFMKGDGVPEFTGEIQEDIGMTEFKTEKHVMSDFQSQTYIKKLEEDTKSDGEGGVYSNSRQASMFVFPNSKTGSDGFKDYITERSDRANVFTTTELFKKDFNSKLESETLLDKIGNCSSKYKAVIENIIDKENEGRLSFVYSNLVRGSGSILFCKLLELFGFSEYNGEKADSISKLTERKRYALITGETNKARIANILRIFNNPANKNGKYIKVIIGSETISEGINLKNIQDIHILTPSWNFTETYQALSRAIRAFSHEDLKSDENKRDFYVKIHLHCSVSKDSSINIDLKMYKISEIKDKKIKLIERLIKESAFDCQLNIARNKIDYKSKESDKDFTRDCEYATCNYTCSNVDEKVDNENLDYSSYLLRYTNQYKIQIKELLSDMFEKSKSGIVLLNEVISKFNVGEIDEKIKNKIILMYITELADDKVVFKLKSGKKGYLSYQENYLFLIKRKHNNNYGYSEYFYEQNTYTELKDNTTSLINQFSDDKAISIIKNAIRTGNMNELKTELTSFQRENILEHCYKGLVQSKEGKTIKNQFFVDNVIKTFGNYIVEADDMYVSTMLQPVLRAYNKRENTWKTLDENEAKKWVEKCSISKKKKDENKEKNKYEMLGTYDEKGKFKIRTKKEGEFQSGRACITSPLKDLLNFIKIIGVDILEIEDDRILKTSQRFKKEISLNGEEIKGDVSSLSSKNQLSLINKIKANIPVLKINNKPYKEDAKEYFSQLGVDGGLDLRVFLNITNLARQKKEVLCEIIEKFLTYKELFIQSC